MALINFKSDGDTRSFQMPGNFSVTSTGAIHTTGLIKMNIFPSSFRIESKGKVIYIDPYVIENAKPADYIFITHPHMDHMSIPNVKKIVKKETLIVCPKAAVKKLAGYNVKEVKPGESFELGDIKCETTASYNTKPGLLWMPLHPKSANFVGYILTLGGVRVYHAGDTDRIPEMKEIKNITVAMIPIGTGPTAMDPKQAAAMINEMKPNVAIPMHYALGKNAARNFRDMADKDVQVEILQDWEQ